VNRVIYLRKRSPSVYVRKSRLATLTLFAAHRPTKEKRNNVIDSLTIAVAGACLALDRNIDDCKDYFHAFVILEWSWYGDYSELYVTAEPAIKPTRAIDLGGH
jgi:hypothetical protein